jgi:hypothetical protein
MLCGACMALLGWGLGRVLSCAEPLVDSGVRGTLLAMAVSLGLGMIEAAWSIPACRIGARTASVLLGVLVGSLGGLLGGVIGQQLQGEESGGSFSVLSWTISGLLIGVSIGAYGLLAGVRGRKGLGGPLRQVGRGMLGGAAGGMLGGALAEWFRVAWEGLFQGKTAELLWSPSAGGFIVLGACIGLATGLARVLFGPAWIRVEKGYRPGRERLLTEAEITIGRDESCDIGLFGDAGVAPVHARIIREGKLYVVLDAGSPGGTFVNGQDICHRFYLQSGDRIQVGDSVLVFYQRQQVSATG